jgi:hypothetical protein
MPLQQHLHCHTYLKENFIVYHFDCKFLIFKFNEIKSENLQKQQIRRLLT